MRTLTLSNRLYDYTLNEVEAVQFVANLLEIPEYQVFHLAYENWNGKKLSNRSMDFRFNNYLENEIVPFWVWHFVQSVSDKYQNHNLDPLEYGIEPNAHSKLDRWKGWLYLAVISGAVVFYCWFLSTVEPYVEMSFG